MSLSPFRTRASLLAFLLGLSAATLQAADRMALGQWEYTLTSEGSTHTVSHCVTQDEASAVNGSEKSAREAAEKNATRTSRGRCTVRSFGIKGDTVSYTLVCGDRTIESTATFHGDTSEGVLATTTGGKAIQTQVKARRLGACK